MSPPTTTPEPPSPPLMGLARMARRLGVTQRWLRDEADAGRVPHLRAGTRYLFAPAAVEAALAARAARKTDTREEDCA
jgi:excisionase family DNA binding protein